MRQFFISLIVIIVLLIVFAFLGRDYMGQSDDSIPASQSESATSLSEDSYNTISPEVVSAGQTILSLLTTVPGLRIKQSECTIEDDRYLQKVLGKVITIEGSFKSFKEGQTPDRILLEKLREQGWKEDLASMADGPDGTAFALRKNPVLCMFQASWDGGDCTDTTYIPDDRYALNIRCMLDPEQPVSQEP